MSKSFEKEVNGVVKDAVKTATTVFRTVTLGVWWSQVGKTRIWRLPAALATRAMISSRSPLFQAVLVAQKDIKTNFKSSFTLTRVRLGFTTRGGGGADRVIAGRGYIRECKWGGETGESENSTAFLLLGRQLVWYVSEIIAFVIFQPSHKSLFIQII